MPSRDLMSVVRWVVPGLVVSLTAAMCGAPGADQPTAGGSASTGASPTVAATAAASQPSAAAPATVLVSDRDGGTVTPIDVVTGKAGRAYKVGKNPVGVAISSDNSTAMVANLDDGTVTVGSLAAEGTSTIKVGKQPFWVAFTPDGATAFVTNTGDNTVSPVAVTTGAVGKPIKVGHFPAGVAVAPDGATAWVANRDDGTLTAVTVTSGAVGSPVKVGGSASGVVITPDGATAYVTDPDKNTVVPVTLATGAAGKPIAVGEEPSGLAVTPDGATVFVTNFGGTTVTPITVASNTAGSPITVGQAPAGIAITLDGATAYVANSGDGTVTPITVASLTAGPVIKVGGRPTGVGLPFPRTAAASATVPPSAAPTTPSAAPSSPTTTPTCWNSPQGSPDALPVGMLVPMAQNFAPQGFFAARGYAPYVLHYPQLAKVLGTTYGGDGTSTFGLPDMKIIPSRGDYYTDDDYYGPHWYVVADKTPEVAGPLPHPYVAGEVDVTAGPADQAADLTALAPMATKDETKQVNVWANNQSPDPGRPCYFAQLGLFTGDLPDGWVEAKGQTFKIRDNTALFSLLGVIYGGNGMTTFALPDLPTKVDGARWAICTKGIYPHRQ